MDECMNVHSVKNMHLYSVSCIRCHMCLVWVCIYAYGVIYMHVSGVACVMSVNVWPVARASSAHPAPPLPQACVGGHCFPHDAIITLTDLLTLAFMQTNYPYGQHTYEPTHTQTHTHSKPSPNPRPSFVQ